MKQYKQITDNVVRKPKMDHLQEEEQEKHIEAVFDLCARQAMERFFTFEVKPLAEELTKLYAKAHDTLNKASLEIEAGIYYRAAEEVLRWQIEAPVRREALHNALGRAHRIYQKMLEDGVRPAEALDQVTDSHVDELIREVRGSGTSTCQLSNFVTGAQQEALAKCVELLQRACRYLSSKVTKQLAIEVFESSSRASDDPLPKLNATKKLLVDTIVDLTGWTRKDAAEHVFRLGAAGFTVKMGGRCPRLCPPSQTQSAVARFVQRALDAGIIRKK